MTTEKRVRELSKRLGAVSQLALVRCDAGKPFNGQDVDIQKLTILLRKWGLIEEHAWRCTELGHQVVAYLCGVAYWPAPGNSLMPANSKFDGTGHTMADAISDGRACSQCQGELPSDTRCIWVQGEGLFHIDCVEQPS